MERFSTHILVFIENEGDGLLIGHHLRQCLWTVEMTFVRSMLDKIHLLEEHHWDLVIVMHNRMTQEQSALWSATRKLDKGTPTIFIARENIPKLPPGSIFLFKRHLSHLMYVIEKLVGENKKKISDNLSSTISFDQDPYFPEVKPLVLRFCLVGSRFIHSLREVQLATLSGSPRQLFGSDEQRFWQRLKKRDRWGLMRQLTQAVRSKDYRTWTGYYEDIDHQARRLWACVICVPYGDNKVSWHGFLVELDVGGSESISTSDPLSVYTSADPLLLEMVREEERERIGQEIHDELGNTLLTARLDLAWLKKHSEFPEHIQFRFDRITDSIQLTLQAIRRIARDLRPGILRDFGLVEALNFQAEDFQEKTGLKIDFSSNVSQLNLKEKTALTLFRIQQEALTNIAKHASATTVAITLSLEKSRVSLTIADDGVGVSGFDLQKPKSMGLKGMMERAERSGGYLTVSNRMGGGFCVKVDLPSPE